MAPSKENDVLTITPDLKNASTTPRSDETASRPQPVALEVPVTVNGARTVEGSDKREPFSETTKTVLVFGNGAVIRLGSTVAAGQLLFLTNEKTKKEVVCQVVKSKNYRSASGYVELEFTEPVVGFWGMRFPTDRDVTPVPARPAAPSATAGSSIAGVPLGSKAGMVSAPRAPEPKPLPQPATSSPVSAPQIVAAVPEIPAAPVVPAVNAPEAPATRGPEPPVTHAAGVSSSLATSLASLLDEDETQTVLPDRAQNKPAPSAGSSETETLKQHTARLQEQLSSMLFNSAPGAKKVAQKPTAKAPDVRASSGVIKQVLEIAKSDAPSASLVLPARSAPPPVKSSLDTEEVKIPAWLEPLARNAAAPSSTQELIEREKSRHAAQLAPREEAAEEPLSLAPAEAPAAVDDLPGIGNLLPLDEGAATKDGSSGKSGKGLMLGAIAAGILMAAGGAWYYLQPARNAQNTSAQATLPVASQPRTAAPSLPSPQPAGDLSAQPGNPPIVDKTAEASTPPVAPPQVSTPSSTVQPASNVSASKSPANSRPPVAVKENSRATGSEIPAAEKEPVARTKPQPEPEPVPAAKKQTLGEVHLASPMMNRHTTKETEAAPTLSSGADVPEVGGLNSGLGASDKEASPSAPLAVGGDVTPAKLLSQVSPIYPAMARSQHISGDVVIDALIDTNGRVTTMKVISGPTLLHQAAKDALRQWKYRPATLDGNPVSMHLTVKLQFRMP